MIFDSNAFIGEWPFRRLQHNTGDGLLRLMDKLGVQKAAVSSLFALFYKDCAVANRRLQEEIRGREDRLIPVGTINPAFPGWQDDLKECKEMMGVRAIKLFPAYHNYRFNDNVCAEAVSRITDHGLPVILSHMFEDPRVHHWLLNILTPEPKEMADLLKQFPKERIVLASAVFGVATQLQKLAPESGFCVETSKIEGPVMCIPRLVEAFGHERVLLGTAMPFMNPAGALLAAQQPGLTEEARSAVLSGNAARLFLQTRGRDASCVKRKT
jgi:predicted TIM-barrel fold metal-dependent hydrolase